MNIVWKIIGAQSFKSVAGNPDVISSITWSCTASEDVDGKVMAESVHNTTSLPMEFNSFIPFEDLTEEVLLSWVWNNGAEKEIVEDEIKAKLSEKINNPVQAKPLPWLNIN
jgi:hypothetical protein